MKVAFIVITSILGTCWLLFRLVPTLLWSVSILWVVLGLAVVGLMVARACKG